MTVASNRQCTMVLVGDSRCGKTSLLNRFLSDMFPVEYKPTGFGRHSVKRTMKDELINFVIWDTSGCTAYNTVRPLSYHEAEVILLCFQIGNRESLQNITQKWFPEVVKYCPGVPVLLCGCQSDKRAEVGRSNDIQISLDDKGYCDESIGVSLEEALSISRRISAVTYVETSAKLSLNSVSEAFEMAALAAMGRLNRKHSGVERPLPLTKYETTLKEQKRKSCCIM